MSSEPNLSQEERNRKHAHAVLILEALKVNNEALARIKEGPDNQTNSREVAEKYRRLADLLEALGLGAASLKALEEHYHWLSRAMMHGKVDQVNSK